MNGSDIILLLFVIRLIIPVGILVLVGVALHRMEKESK
jgi:hypothetical protein